MDDTNTAPIATTPETGFTVALPSGTVAPVPVTDASLPAAPTAVADTAPVDTSDKTTQETLDTIAAGGVADHATTQTGQGFDDPNPDSTSLQAKIVALQSEVSTLKLVLIQYFQNYHRNEGWINDDGTFNLDQ